MKGPARSIKTTAAENHLLKIGKFGPSRNVLWYMHSTSDLEDYVEERGEFFMTEHEDIQRKVGKTPRENSRLRKKVDGKIWRWLAANKSTTRGKAAPYIVVDEVDAMRKDIRRSITTLIRNRQREFGNMAKAYIASHSDEGPTEGIDALLVDSDLRVRMWRCIDCNRLASPAAEAPEGRRIVWNMADLMTGAEEMEREALLDYVAEHICLSCPHCGSVVDNAQRLVLDQSGEWFGRGQSIDANEQIVGERIDTDTAGFVIHAFMSPFVTLAGLAREWAAAKLNQLETGNHALLKEVSVKSLGETYRIDIAASKRRVWKEVRARHVDTGYRVGQVPRGVDFLTAMVDVQGDRFEAGVVGWSANRESWLIGRYPLRQIRRKGEAAAKDISPGSRLSDWDILEEFMARTFPLNDGTGRVLGIAKLGVDTGGVAGVTNNARLWAANLQGRAVNPIPAWRLALLKGQGNMKAPKGELYTKKRQILEDDANRPLPVPVLERTVYTDDVKMIMADRLEIDTPGAGFMHLPQDVEDKHVRELVAESYENGQWISRGRNETWDIWVGAEVCRSLLAPDYVSIDWQHDRPVWATPFLPSAVDDIDEPEETFVSKLAALNRGRQREEY